MVLPDGRVVVAHNAAYDIDLIGAPSLRRRVRHRLPLADSAVIGASMVRAAGFRDGADGIRFSGTYQREAARNYGTGRTAGLPRCSTAACSTGSSPPTKPWHSDSPEPP
ncbi:hypothetical protein [Cryobacterium lyxosi]|uniref:Exonuclease domain-containing protein n=1 Tax=Cryobacterium lyxosi TaxID=1259228 RepID=A0A4R8ZCS4_9MICO|nr:hypothetical protein [Cryobacterium lyxosi]TFD25160.1 hypothetical protein E3T27_10340 [Cryobacterium lyxosi]